MAVAPILADSSFYIQQTRMGRDPFRALAASAFERDLVICGVIRAEVLRGLRERALVERFQLRWNVMLNVPTDERLWQEVASTLWELDRRGTVLPLTDVVIACCARRLGAVVLTLDHHFALIPGIKVISELE